MSRILRNIAIIAHVDHGKTTLIDKLLYQSGALDNSKHINTDRLLDSNDLEKERGITILAKNCSIEYEGNHINIVDTPGHADFGGEVERALSMVDSVLLLVDAVEGPMPQTYFVTRKALKLGLCPIVVINKIDRHSARPDWVINQSFDLFYKLGATEEQLDFPVIYTSALNGYASLNKHDRTGNMYPLLDLILKKVAISNSNVEGPLQLQISLIDYSKYLGKIGIGRIIRGHIKPGQQVILCSPINTNNILSCKINQVLIFRGLNRIPVNIAKAGDIVLISGITNISIGMTICSPEKPEPLPMISIDEPNLTINFCVNSSPLAGKEGKFFTSRQIRERLLRELHSNVGLSVKDTVDETTFEVSGRGELHLTILIENMRREGYELSLSRPRIISKEINGVKCEPYEKLTVDIKVDDQGIIMKALATRNGKILDISIDNHNNRVRLIYRIAVRHLIGFQNEFLTLTKGTGLIGYIFDEYHPITNKECIIDRRKGVLISQTNGQAVSYALWKLQNRGCMFVKPGDLLYEGMIIGIHNRNNDLLVNPIKNKQLTNIRASCNDEAIHLIPPIQISLEYAIAFINNDELVEVTPKSIRLRKRYLKEYERRFTSRIENI